MRKAPFYFQSLYSSRPSLSAQGVFFCFFFWIESTCTIILSLRLFSLPVRTKTMVKVHHSGDDSRCFVSATSEIQAT